MWLSDLCLVFYLILLSFFLCYYFDIYWFEFGLVSLCGVGACLFNGLILWVLNVSLLVLYVGYVWFC